MHAIFTNELFGHRQSLPLSLSLFSSDVTEEHAAAVQELLDDGDWEVRSCTLEALAGRPEPVAFFAHTGAIIFGLFDTKKANTSSNRTCQLTSRF